MIQSTDALRGGAQQERWRGTSELPLTDQGVRDAHDTAIKLARKGGLSEIHTSSLGRAVHTARIVSNYTHAPIVSVTDALHPWHLGSMEGQPITPEGVAYVNHLQQQEPDTPIEGRGPISTADGESFNAFKERAQGALRDLINRSAAAPDRAIGVVTHYRVKKLLDAWMRKGMDPNGDIDQDEMARHDTAQRPGTIEQLRVDEDHGPQLHDVDLDSPGRLQGGIYLIRHQATAWNKSTASDDAS